MPSSAEPSTPRATLGYWPVKPVSRILSIDYGKKRTGIAVTDPLQIIASGLETVPTATLFDYLKAYIGKETVERIVIGRPTQPNGQPSENLDRVEQFVNRWRKAMPSIPIDYYDEQNVKKGCKFATISNIHVESIHYLLIKNSNL